MIDVMIVLGKSNEHCAMCFMSCQPASMESCFRRNAFPGTPSNYPVRSNFHARVSVSSNSHCIH